MDGSWAVPFLAALAAGAVSGATGFGGGVVLALLLVSGASLLDSLASVKILAASCDVAAFAGLARSGQVRVDTITSRPALACAGGAAMTAAAVASVVSSMLAGIVTVALAAGLVLRHRRTRREPPVHGAGIVSSWSFGAYLAAWGFGGGALWTARRTLGGAPVRGALAEARALGAAGNTAAALVYVSTLSMAWPMILPALAGHMVGAYGAARGAGAWRARWGRAAVPLPATPATARGQSVPSRCISEQVSHRLPPRPSTCE